MLHKGSRKIICIVLAAALALTMSLPASGFAASGPAGGSAAASPKAGAKAAAVSDEAGLISAIENAGSGETIQLQQSIQLTKPLEIPEGKNITLSGSSSSTKLTIHMSDADFKGAQQSYTEALLMVSGTAALRNLTLDGGSKMRVMYIGAGGSVTLERGAAITSGALGNSTINWGAGIRLEGSRSRQAALTINEGAVIRDNRALGKYYITGIGICNSKYGSIVMNGGTISGNTDLTTGTARYFSYGGGVALDGTGTSFVMNGGTISGNSAKAAGGGVYVSAGKDGFTMNGGTISSNSTTASGGGLYVSGAASVMNSGTITGNTAQSNTDQTAYACGGGVYIAGTSGNDGTNAARGSFTLKGGSISKNTARTTAAQNRYDAQFGQGGGVMVSGNFYMEGGSISGNTAAAAENLAGDTGCGGGVSIKGGTYSGSLIMTGGTISDNQATGKGGAVYMNNKDLEGNLLYPSLAEIEPYRGSGLFSLRGQIQISTNTAAGNADNVYLTKDCAMTIAGPLAGGSRIYAGSETTTIGSQAAKAASGYTITEADASLIKSNQGDSIYGLKDGAVVLLQGEEPGTEPEPGTETDISKAQITGVNSSYTYTGKAVRPAPTVKLNGETLRENQDYALSYDGTGISARKLIDAGTKTLLIEGLGSYEGQLELTYKIAPAPISKASVSAIKDQIFAGKACTPSPASVTYSGTALLKAKDYKLTYSANTKPGLASARLQGMGNFSGTKTVHFRILPDKTALQKAASSKKGQAAVTWGKVTGASGYEILTAYNSKFTKGKKVKTIKGAKGKATVSSLKSKKTCYVRVRAYTNIAGKKCYGPYSSAKKVTIK